MNRKWRYGDPGDHRERQRKQQLKAANGSRLPRCSNWAFRPDGEPKINAPKRLTRAQSAASLAFAAPPDKTKAADLAGSSGFQNSVLGRTTENVSEADRDRKGGDA